MPYQYLNNQAMWGDTAQGVGDSFNNAAVGLMRLRWAQAQQAQQQAMDRAYLDLAVRKLAQEQGQETSKLGMEKERLGFEKEKLAQEAPFTRAQTGYDIAKTKESEIATKANEMAMEQSRKSQSLADLVMSANMAKVAPNLQTMQSQTPPGLMSLIGPDQFSNQQSLSNALQNFVVSAGLQTAMQAPQQVGGNFEKLLYPQPPTQPVQKLAPEQDAFIRLLSPILRGYMAPGPSGEPRETDRAMGLLNQAMTKIGGTNAPQLGVPAGEVPASVPKNQRPIGHTVTTAKGTFRWNGTGWDPVAQ